MANSFTYNGEDFGDTDHGVTVIDFQDPLLADPRLDTQPRGGANGVSSRCVTLGPLYLNWVCMLEGSSRSNMMTKLDTVISELDPRNGALLLLPDHYNSIDAEVNRGCYARLNGPIIVQPKGDMAVVFNLTWEVPAGRWISATASGQSATAIDANPKTIYEPSGAADVVRGTGYARPTYTLVNTHAATLSTLTLTNVTTSEAMTWTGSLAQNNQLRIDTAEDRLHVEKSTDGGTTWSNAMSGVAVTQEFPRLAPGVRNQFTVAGFVTGTLTISYRGVFG